MTQKEQTSRNTFSKNERMNKKKEIDLLFQKGTTISKYPFIVKYTCMKYYSVSQVLFSISKKKMKRAVDRNKIRRRMRESYRLNKNILLQKKNNYAIVFIYTSHTLLPFSLIQEKIILSLKQISEKNTDA